MKVLFPKKDKLIVVVITLLLVILIPSAYFFFVQPLNSELQEKEQTLKTEQKLLSVFQNKNQGIKDTKFENTAELQQMIPVKPLVEQIILDLEKAEVVSNSSIKSMSFTKDGVKAEQESDQPAEQNQSSQQESSISQADTESDKKVTASVLNVPEGVKKLTVQLTVESPGYEELEQFIEKLENLKRIVVVEAIEFSGGKEITSLEQEDGPLIYNLTVSAFYMPDLTDLQNQLPKMETPEPANKRNPLSNFPEITEAETAAK